MQSKDKKTRWERLEQKLKEENLEAFLLTNSVDIFYFSGLWIKGAVLFTPQEKFFIIPPMHQEKVKRRKDGWKVAVYEDTLEVKLGKLSRKMGIKGCGFESNRLSFSFYKKIKEEFKPQLVPCSVVEKIRAIKDGTEIDFIKKAGQITKGVFEQLRRIVHTGITEKEIAKKAINYILKETDEISFYPIVLFGERTSLPHGRPTDRELRKNELVLMDIGGKVRGYCADITRTFGWGRIPEKWEKIYNFVQKVKQMAIQHIEPGVKASKIDKMIREESIKAGYRKKLLHGIGHGVGLEVHEQPILNRSSNTTLEEGMVTTLEPGIYFPGEGGVRTEDMVLITKEGALILP